MEHDEIRKTYHSQDITSGAVRTGYYAKARSYPGPVCISRSNKGDFPEIPELAPSSHILSRYKYIDHDERAYAESYAAQLDRIEWDAVCAKAGDIIRQNGAITLLCFEKPGDFCHRHAAAERLSRELVKRGILTGDQISSPSEEIADEQPSLFD